MTLRRENTGRHGGNVRRKSHHAPTRTQGLGQVDLGQQPRQRLEPPSRHRRSQKAFPVSDSGPYEPPHRPVPTPVLPATGSSCNRIRLCPPAFTHAPPPPPATRPAPPPAWHGVHCHWLHRRQTLPPRCISRAIGRIDAPTTARRISTAPIRPSQPPEHLLLAVDPSRLSWTSGRRRELPCPYATRANRPTHGLRLGAVWQFPIDHCPYSPQQSRHGVFQRR